MEATTRLRWLWVIVAASTVLGACSGDDDVPTTDGGHDAGQAIDAGGIDAGASPMDGGVDAGPRDAGSTDAGLPDAGPADAGLPDAGPADAGLPDAGSTDAGPPDAGPTDAGSLGYPLPVAYWPMDMADITGTSLHAAVGGHDGTLGGGVTTGAGQVATSLSFDGLNDQVDMQDVLDEVFAGVDKRFTIAVWVRLAVATPTTPLVVYAKNADSACTPAEDGRELLLTVSTAGHAIFGYQALAAGSTNLVTGDTPLGTAWHQVVVVYDGAIDTAGADRVTMYVDGVVQTETSVSTGTFPFDIGDGTAHFAVGTRVSSTGAACVGSGAQRFAGSVDELAIWSSALDAAQIGAIYARNASGMRVVP